MRENASFNGLRRLFSFTAIAALSIALLFLSGCGHKCGCDGCHRNSCSTCNTCGVSDNSVPSNTVCTACQSGTCNTVGTAPASLSEPVVVQTPPRQFVNAPAYSTGSNYNGTNASLERAGESRDLPVFSAPVAPPPPVATQAYVQPPAGALVQDAPVRSGGQYHTLQQGETVYALSRKYGVKAKTILDANHFNDPNHLSVGTKVFIPAN